MYNILVAGLNEFKEVVQDALEAHGDAFGFFLVDLPRVPYQGPGGH